MGINLEHEISSGLTELRRLLGTCSTYSVVRWCFSYHVSTAHRADSTGQLVSPGKQIPFLLAVLLSGQEPEKPVDFNDDILDLAKPILNNLFFAYMSLYMPSKGEFGKLAPEPHRVRKVAMLAFLHYFNSGLLASVHQVVERVELYLAPFDAELSKALGINANDAIAICQWIADQLQKSRDDLQISAREVLEETVRDPSYLEKAEKLISGMKELGLVSLSRLEAAFPGKAGIFWDQFSVKRGEAPEIRYPTERSIYEIRPLIRVSDTKAFCPIINALFNAVLLVGEQTLLQNSVRDRFLRSRDKTLEKQALTKIRSFLSPEASIWSEVYETPDCQYEHDVIVVDQGLFLLIEAKAAPPIEPFRDPDKAFIRLRDAFRSDKGIQKAYEQGNRIVRKLKAGKTVPLYDARRCEVGRLLPDDTKLPIGICVTRDNYGPLATNLALLLEKDASDSYPWVVNILDLGNLAEAWSYFGWGPAELRKYLEQRIQLNGKIFSDDELDYAGFFIRHGSFDSAIESRADILQLNPEYSSLFDKLYYHLHMDGPPVTIKQTEPVLTDLKRSLAEGELVFVENRERTLQGRKIGRNEPCPCGSGKKYKRCCGGIH